MGSAKGSSTWRKRTGFSGSVKSRLPKRWSRFARKKSARSSRWLKRCIRSRKKCRKFKLRSRRFKRSTRSLTTSSNTRSLSRTNRSKKLTRSFTQLITYTRWRRCCTSIVTLSTSSRSWRLRPNLTRLFWKLNRATHKPWKDTCGTLSFSWSKRSQLCTTWSK